MNKAIELIDLKYAYGNRVALDNFSLEISEGSVFGFVGPNGGGKTTLFKILSSLLSPQSGEVFLLGENLRSHRSSIRNNIGVVFQSPALDKMLTVWENILYQGYFFGLSRKQAVQSAKEMLSRVGLFERKNELVSALSGGLQRRLEIAKALIHRPKILIMDEPTTGLDPIVRNELWTFLFGLRKESGVTILFSTHLLDEADRCNEIVLIDNGKILAKGNPFGLKDNLEGEVLTISPVGDPGDLRSKVEEHVGVEAAVINLKLRFRMENAVEHVPSLYEKFRAQIASVKVGKPGLEDLFFEKTGHQYMGGSV